MSWIARQTCERIRPHIGDERRLTGPNHATHWVIEREGRDRIVCPKLSENLFLLRIHRDGLDGSQLGAHAVEEVDGAPITEARYREVRDRANDLGGIERRREQIGRA